MHRTKHQVRMVKHAFFAFVIFLAGATTLSAADVSDTHGFNDSGAYRLQPGDLLTVNVWKETDLQSEVLIRPDGGISFPLAGDLKAAGLTTDELRAALQERVRRLIPEAVVTVSVKAPNGNRVFVIGKVNRPGDFPLLRPTDVMQALSLAGGTTPFADTDAIRVLHREGSRQVSVRFRYSDVARGRHLEQNILLQSGDTVIVP